MKKIRMIKKQAVLAIVSLLLCAVTITGFAFSGPSKEAAAAETDDFQIELIPLEEDEEDIVIEKDSSDEDSLDENGDEEDADADTPDGEEQDTDDPEGDEPGNEDVDPGDEQEPEEEPVCDCTSHCKKDDIDDTCPVCSTNYKNCVWIDPKVAIAIDNPTDWKTKATKIGITVVDENNSGHFFIKKVEARIGSTGSYTDITDDMYVTISENCTLYIQVTEENGTVTSKSRKFSCFDTDKPSVNAGIEGELLYVEADDATSGIYAIYVNGSKFTDLNEGKLTINLKDYDSVYEYVTIQAYDHAGNRSNSYKIKNPYYVDPEKRENKDDQSVNNPTSIQPTAPTSSKATVTEHTDKEGNTKPGVGKNPVNTDVEEDEDTEAAATSTSNDGGKEFYTITTASDKIFYLIIDKDRSQENVYLLTEVNENDLLNFVNYNGEHVTQGELPLYTVDPEVVDANKPDAEADDVINVPEEPEVEEPEEPKKTGNNNTLILIAIIAAIGGVVLYFFKKKGKKSDYDYEADAEDIDTFEPVEDSSDDDDEDDILFDDDDEEDGIPADIDESVMEEEDE